jgi:hypothetical protein
MAPTTAPSDSSDPAEESQSIPIHVLSPTSGIPSHMNFRLPLTATIADLKLMILDAAPTKPQPDRQRLIYRGRPLIRDEEKLVDILGNTVVCSAQQE